MRHVLPRRRIVQCFGQSEIENFHRAVNADLDIRRLQIAMDDPLLVRCFEAVRDLPGDRQRFIEGNRSPGDALRQILANHQLHDERMGPVRVVESVDLRDVGMVERRQHLRFSVEARQSIRVVGEDVR